MLYRYRYDKLNRVEEIVYGNDAVTYYYDAAGMRVKQSLSNGIVTSYTYDANNNMTVLEAKSTDGDVLNSYKYKYDKLGNRKTMTTMKGTTTYTYDNNSQLVVADYSDETSERYEYDVNGNRVRLVKTGTEGDTEESYSYNSVNQLVSKETKTEGRGAVDTSTYEYDKIGNLIRKVSLDGEVRYEYNAENKLSMVKSGDEDIASFSYDLFGRRVVKKEGDEEKRYIYDGLNRIAEIDAQDKIKKRFMFGAGIDELIGVKTIDGNDREYFLHDGLGSVAAVLDASGNVKNRYSYSSFGTSVEKPEYYGFTGREYDDSSGLYYYRARYYNSKLGRFTQQDPLGMPDGMNRYIYVNNNPGNWVDPLGLKTYYINRKFGTVIPTNNPISHSFIATTNRDASNGNEVVNNTYSWGNDWESQWLANNPDDMKAAQGAINNGVGLNQYGNERLDNFVRLEFNNAKTSTKQYNLIFNNCKQNAEELLEAAMKWFRGDGVKNIDYGVILQNENKSQENKGKCR